MPVGKYSARMGSNDQITIRLDKNLKASVKAAMMAHPFEITFSSIATRGLELALEEMSRMNDARLKEK